MSLFRLAWSSKIRIPLLITVAFLAMDVNLQVEINVFWAPIDREVEGRENEDRERRRRNGMVRATRPRHLLPSAPLADVEDFEDDDTSDDELSVASSVPSSDSSLTNTHTPQNRYEFWENGRRIPLVYDIDTEEENGITEDQTETEELEALVERLQ